MSRDSSTGTCGFIRTPPGPEPAVQESLRRGVRQLGGQPYGCLIGDYSFSHLPKDVNLLRDLSKIAAPRTRRSSPLPDSTLMGMDSWNELMNPRDLSKLFDTPEYAA